MIRGFDEREEYLAWEMGIVSNLWIDGRKDEAKFLAESIRRLITRTINHPTEFEKGLSTLTSGLVHENKVRGDLVWHEVESEHHILPWSLISKIGDKYIVRLILRRCGNGILCGHDICECHYFDDCDRVEIQSDSPQNWEEAWRELCRLYVSWFFSEKTMLDGIMPRSEINEAYDQIWRKLQEQGLLTEINPLSKDDNKLLQEKLKRRKTEHMRHVEALRDSIAEDYDKKLPLEVEKWRNEFDKNILKDPFRGSLKENRRNYRRFLWNGISNLDIVFYNLQRLQKKVEKEQIKGVLKPLNSAIDNLDQTITFLATPETENVWKDRRRFGDFNLTANKSRLLSAYQHLEKTVKILMKHRKVLGVAEIPMGAAAHILSLYTNTHSVMRTLWILDYLIKSGFLEEDLLN